MVAIHAGAPQPPAGAILAKQLVGDREPLRLSSRAGCHGKHPQLSARRKQCRYFTRQNSRDVRLMILIGHHGDAPAIVLDGAYLGKAMIATEIAIRMTP